MPQLRQRRRRWRRCEPDARSGPAVSSVRPVIHRLSAETGAAMRQILDKSGAEWQASEEVQGTFIVIVFRGPGGKTVTAEPTARRLKMMSDDDVSKLLEEGLEQLAAK